MTEDDSLGNSLSVSLKGLGQTGRGGVGNISIWGWEIHVIKDMSWSKITAIHKEHISQVNDYNAFLCMARCKK